MDLKQLTERVKALVSGRGGSQGAKQDGSQVGDTYSSAGTTDQTMNRSGDAMSEPGGGQEGVGGQEGMGGQEDMGVGATGTEEPPPSTEQTP